MTYKQQILAFWKESIVNRAIIVTVLLLLIVGLLFGVYYYSDRYIHAGTVSPIEIELSRLEKLVRENPNDPAARISLVQYYYANSNFKEARDQAEQVLRVYPDYESALYLSGITNLQMGDAQSAVAPLVHFVDIRHKKPVSHTDRYLETALYYLGVTYIQLGDSGHAIIALNELLELNRMDADALYQLGIAYAMNEQHEIAIEQFSNAVRFVPNFTEVYKELIASYSALGKNDLVNYASGMLAFSNQDYKTARTRLEAAAAILKNFNPVYLGLGLTYEQLGDFEAARVNLNRAIQIYPDDYAAGRALGRIQTIIDNQDK